MPHLPDKLSLPILQQYQDNICTERGWDQASVLETYLLFSEEVGELAKAIRYHGNIFTEKGKQQSPDALESELADVLSYLLELANKFEIDLETAFRKKEAINAARVWNHPDLPDSPPVE